MQQELRQTVLGHQEGAHISRVEWEGPGQPRPVFYTQKVKLSIQAEFFGPGEFLDHAWNDITASANAAGVIAGLHTIANSPPQALPAFEDAFFACLSSRWPQEARRLRVGLSTQLQPDGEWLRNAH